MLSRTSHRTLLQRATPYTLKALCTVRSGAETNTKSNFKFVILLALSLKRLKYRRAVYSACIEFTFFSSSFGFFSLLSNPVPT